MAKKKKKGQHQLIVQALNAAETNIRLAKQLLSELKVEPPKPSPKDLPGIVGVFDGENMVTEEGKKYPVNPNYASKSVLVYGDTLKRIEEDGQEKFKQIKRVKRQKVEGILAKKDGKWVAVTADGSYKVSPVAVEFYDGKEGDEVVVVLPLEDKHAPYAALEKVLKKENKKEKTAPKEEKSAKKKTTAKAAKPTSSKPKPEPKEEKKVASESVENDEELR